MIPDSYKKFKKKWENSKEKIVSKHYIKEKNEKLNNLKNLKSQQKNLRKLGAMRTSKNMRNLRKQIKITNRGLSKEKSQRNKK